MYGPVQNVWPSGKCMAQWKMYGPVQNVWPSAKCMAQCKMYGPVQNEDGSWRIRMNYELNELIGNADIVRFIKKAEE